jgi:L-ribulose-5-phosphate 3-epimerase UlaE
LKETTDTGDMHTGSARPKKTVNQKLLKKISRKKTLRVKDLEKPWQTVKADVAYVKQWADQANIEEIKLEEAPF